MNLNLFTLNSLIFFSCCRIIRNIGTYIYMYRPIKLLILLYTFTEYTGVLYNTSIVR